MHRIQSSQCPQALSCACLGSKIPICSGVPPAAEGPNGWHKLPSMGNDKSGGSWSESTKVLDTWLSQATNFFGRSLLTSGHKVRSVLPQSPCDCQQPGNFVAKQQQHPAWHGRKKGVLSSSNWTLNPSIPIFSGVKSPSNCYRNYNKIRRWWSPLSVACCRSVLQADDHLGAWRGRLRVLVLRKLTKLQVVLAHMTRQCGKKMSRLKSFTAHPDNVWKHLRSTTWVANHSQAYHLDSCDNEYQFLRLTTWYRTVPSAPRPSCINL